MREEENGRRRKREEEGGCAKKEDKEREMVTSFLWYRVISHEFSVSSYQMSNFCSWTGIAL